MRGLRTIALATGLLLAACGGGTTRTRKTNGSAEPDPVASGGASAPESAGVAAGAGGVGASCEHRSLAELCQRMSCPTSPENVGRACGDPGTGFAFTSTCGVSIEVRRGGTEIWHFNAEHELVGAVVSAGAGPCPGIYGEECVATAPARDACHLNDSCPARPLEEYCSDAAGDPCITLAEVCKKIDIVSGRSSCDGYVVSVGFRPNPDLYSFDLQAKLIGIRFGSDEIRLCDDGTRATGDSFGQVCEFAHDAGSPACNLPEATGEGGAE